MVQRRHVLILTTCALTAAFLGSSWTANAIDVPVTLSEPSIPAKSLCDIKAEWLATLQAQYPNGGWAPLRVPLSDTMLEKMGLPNAEYLRTHRALSPTLFLKDGASYPVELPPVGAPQATGGTAGTASFAGSGCFGIRPGAWLLSITAAGVGWCSMAHVYGSPGSYQISTAGHCGKTGDVATVIAATGDRTGAIGLVLLDFGKFSYSTGDAGIGKDWALVSVDAAWQHLVSPTMCEFGGPIGTYTKTGAVATLTWSRGLPSGVATSPDPTLASTIVHYGHGTGVGAGGTGRAGQVIEWKLTDYSFLGTITPGDSGSGSNVILGDAIGTEREAAGINTHLYVGTSYYAQYGLGVMAGTRTTQVKATLANGQLLPYPVPIEGAP